MIKARDLLLVMKTNQGLERLMEFIQSQEVEPDELLVLCAFISLLLARKSNSNILHFRISEIARRMDPLPPSEHLRLVLRCIDRFQSAFKYSKNDETHWFRLMQGARCSVDKTSRRFHGQIIWSDAFMAEILPVILKHVEGRKELVLSDRSPG